MDSVSMDSNVMQSYVLLSTEQLQKIGELFEVHDREGISHAVQTIVDQYIHEHETADVKKVQADAAWKDFTNKFNEGWFDNRSDKVIV